MLWTRERCWICLASKHKMLRLMRNPHCTTRTPHCSTRSPHSAKTTRICARPRYGGKPCTKKRSADAPNWRVHRRPAAIVASSPVLRWRPRPHHTRLSPAPLRVRCNCSAPASDPSARRSKAGPNRASVLHNPPKPCGSAAAQGRPAATRRSDVRRHDCPRQPRPAVHAATGSQIELMQTLRPQLTPETATKSAQCGQHGWIHDRASHPPCHSTDLFHH